jgi:signal transduction histidine kinase
MNRLWIRFSLVIMGSILLLVLVLFGSRLLFEMQRWPEIRESIPPGVAGDLRTMAQREIWHGLTYLVVIGGLVSVAVGVWFSRGLTAPLSRLETAAHAIQAQDFSYRVPVRGSRELRAVATAFNGMSDQLEQAETLRSNLLADVAHELRGPLHLLQGNLQAILDGVYPLDQGEIARLFDQTHHLTTLVNDLHELAQAEAHRLPLHRGTTDLAALVQDTSDVFRPVAADRDVALQVELLGPIPSVEVDAARIRQVVYNLLSNALRHTPAGGIITIRAYRTDDSVQVSVSDTGAGIAPGHLLHVFDRFYRTDTDRSRDKGGTGLGLAIAQAIVTEHGGQITATSPGPGEGATFTFSLPL